MKLEPIFESCSSSEWFYRFQLLQFLFIHYICNFFGQWRRKLIIHPYATLPHSQSMASPVHHMRHHNMNRVCFLMAWTLLLLSYQPVPLFLCLSAHFQLSCFQICPHFPFAIICILILCLFYNIFLSSWASIAPVMFTHSITISTAGPMTVNQRCRREAQSTRTWDEHPLQIPPLSVQNTVGFNSSWRSYRCLHCKFVH